MAYQIPLVAPVVGDIVVRDGRYARAILRAGWGDESAWDDEAADLYVDVLRKPRTARASSLYYRHFLARDVLEGARGTFAGRRLAMPARLLLGRRDPLGTAFAEGFERHGHDAALELIDGCGHFVPEERPDLVAERARELAGRAA
jgi:pimeloyl-ACP methyl ester carboxylesterase